jgi:hypothetical protein
MELLLEPQAWLSFLTLTVLEIVLGIDNIIFLVLLVGRLPEGRRRSARYLGLGFAAITRIALLLSVVWLTRLRTPLFRWYDQDISIRDLALFAGGIFLVIQSVKEIRDMLRLESPRRGWPSPKASPPSSTATRPSRPSRSLSWYWSASRSSPRRCTWKFPRVICTSRWPFPRRWNGSTSACDAGGNV